ncbi:hypothetical protein A3Q56_05893 [Intoshia linei]|uniref:Uncharacterized protein n=1 Tax=Intoshia linei TaxID=1819745 RepID=A0A177AWH8_9BILA|nr:hypothetical protein A3Q56_05893 [Intoshia linei]
MSNLSEFGCMSTNGLVGKCHSSESIKINIQHLAYIISENCDNDEYSLKINDCGEILPNSQCCVFVEMKSNLKN